MTFVDSVAGIYVEILHSLTHAIAADSVSCFDVACEVTPFFIISMKCFFFKWRGEHGAPVSALTISSKTFYKTNLQHSLMNCVGKEKKLKNLRDIKPIKVFAAAK